MHYNQHRHYCIYTLVNPEECVTRTGRHYGLVCAQLKAAALRCPALTCPLFVGSTCETLKRQKAPNQDICTGQALHQSGCANKSQRADIARSTGFEDVIQRTM
jgi:hypothetical protein